jgi:tRNA1Val (adenine37-N6)-methyltransferase
VTKPGNTENHKNIELSGDSLFDGDLKCYQSISGYRFSVDSVLIAHFVKVRDDDRILDLGTGCGIIMLLLLYRWGNRLGQILGVEIQESLADLALKNLTANGFENKGRAELGDIKKLSAFISPESYDTIVCNPPFYSPGSGRRTENCEARFARHQILATLDDFLAASSLTVKNKGSVYFIYPAGQLGTFISLIDRHRLAVKTLQFVYSYPQAESDARLILIECRKNGGPGVKILPPFYIYRQKNGAFSPEMQNFYTRNSDPLL